MGNTSSETYKRICKSMRCVHHASEWTIHGWARGIRVACVMGCRLFLGKQCNRREGMGLSRLRKSNENDWAVDESISLMEFGAPMS